MRARLVWIIGGALSLLACGGPARLSPSYTIPARMGMFYTKLPQHGTGFYYHLVFRRLDSAETVDHLIDRVPKDNHDTDLITLEFNPGKWRLKYVYFQTGVVGREMYYPTSDSLPYEFTVAAGKANYFPDIDFSTDCKFRETSLGRIMAICTTYSVTLRDRKTKADSEFVALYPQLKGAVPDANCLASQEWIGREEKGRFWHPRETSLRIPVTPKKPMLMR